MGSQVLQEILHHPGVLRIVEFHFRWRTKKIAAIVRGHFQIREGPFYGVCHGVKYRVLGR